MNIVYLLAFLVALPFLYVFVITGWVLYMVLFCAFTSRNDTKDAAQEQAFKGAQAGLFTRIYWLCTEGMAQSLALFMHLLYFLRLVRHPRGPANAMPVLILPGWTESPGEVWFLGRWLARRGFNPFLLDFPSTFSAVAKNVAFVRAELAKIREQTGAKQVAIIGHSMGGLVGRALIHTDPDCGVVVLVTIASPHRGTHTAEFCARLGMKGSLSDMTPGRWYCQNFPPSLIGKVPIHSIVGFQEDIVAPAWSCVISEGETVVLDVPTGHVAPLFLERVYLQVERWLLKANVVRSSP